MEVTRVLVLIVGLVLTFAGLAVVIWRDRWAKAGEENQRRRGLAYRPSTMGPVPQAILGAILGALGLAIVTIELIKPLA